MNDFTEVSAVVTHPDHGGKGYTRQLIAYTINKISDENKTPYLHVAETNTRAIKLYDKPGFTKRRKSSFWNFQKNRFKEMKRSSLLVVILLLVYNLINAQKQTRHFVFFAHERERIHEKNFLNNDHIAGAQLKYTWRELEPKEDQYHLELIQKDLDFLTLKGKKLFIQLQDVSFDTIYKCVPDYIMQNKLYHGGADIQYQTTDDDRIVKQNGYVARRWDTAVAKRFYKLLFVLGKRFDGIIEGINLPETSVGFGETGKLFPGGYNTDAYKEAVMSYMETLKKAFPESVVIQYANFMPGEWLPSNDKSYLKDLYAFAKEKKIGMGGPDIKVYNKGHMNNGYKFLKEYSNDLITGLAVQDGNYKEINPKTGKQVTIEEIYDFGKNYIGLNYIFWCTEEPFYSKDVLPFLKTSGY